MTCEAEYRFVCLFVLYIFFSEVSVPILCPFLKSGRSLSLGFTSSWYTLDDSPLSHMPFVTIASQSGVCLLLLLNLVAILG